MNRKLIHLDEPKLLFQYDQSAEDPRDGLALFGPYESFPAYSIQAGVIGTEEGIDLYRTFVGTIQNPICTDSVQRPTFTGFEAIFGIDWPSKPTIVRMIDNDVLKKKLSIRGLKERTYNLADLYLDEIKKVQDEEEERVDLWFVVVPKNLWLKCRPRSADSSRLQAQLPKLTAYRQGQQVLFPDMEEELKTLNTILDMSADFHHQLKARLLQEGVKIPVQIILEPTLQFRDKYRNWEYKPEMKAYLAWTQSTAVYYKLGKLPWKLENIRKGVCYVGLVFKKYERLKHKGYACSAAQMFLDSGDGTVFRGNIGPWKSRSSSEFHLDRDSAKELLTLAMESYFSKRNEYPSELFIHGRASFAGEEWQGFEEAVEELDSNTRLVGVVIKESGKLKLFRDIEGHLCRYGNLRGLGLVVDELEGFLWTRGFIPRLNTSTSLEIPNPLRIRIDKGEAEITQVLKDILCLSKLNYNACIYGDGLPVTLRFADMIGSILTAVDSVGSRVLPFKYYI